MRKVEDYMEEPKIDQVPAHEGGTQDEQDKIDNSNETASEESVDAKEKFKQERDEYYDLLLRKQAEFENYRRRVNREKLEIRSTVKIELLSELLPVLDACEKGLLSMQQESADSLNETFLDGYKLMIRELELILDKNEVKRVPGVGEVFDPNVHEAVIREITSDFKEGEILEEFRKGYQLGDRLLRPSQVKVAVWPEEENDQD